MNKLRIASAVAALASALALPAWAANANDTTKDNAANLDQPVQQGAIGNGAAQSGSTATHAKSRKHPPTAAMDSATPTEKTNDNAATTRHPPTTQMDRAAPDQKSPGTGSDTSPTGNGASAVSPRN